MSNKILPRALQTSTYWSGLPVWDEYSQHVLGGSGRSGALRSYCHLQQGNEPAVQLHQLDMRVLRLAVRRDVCVVCNRVQQHVLQ